MRFYDDFIGTDEHNQVNLFTCGDSKEQFDFNKTNQPDDWYYNNANITYDFNNKGHRCKNIEDVDLDNYVLFTGCSHTMGVGLELEKTYPYIASQQLGYDYYNLAIPATGIDVVEYNLLTWWFKIEKKPKYVFVQLPDHSRFVSYFHEYDHIVERGTWSGDDTDLRFIVNSEDTGFFNARKMLHLRTIKNIINVPIYTFNFGAQISYDYEDWHMKQLDKARDLSHSGILSNIEFAKQVCNRIIIP
jgi:hypothetical protein